MGKLRILLVDDEKDCLLTISKQIESCGYKVIPVSSGKKAVEIIRNKEADIAILDYKMADTDGVSVLREIRKIDEKIPVLMFTSFPDEESLQATKTLGINAYIPKYGIFFPGESSLKTTIKMIEKQLRLSV